MYLYFTDAVCFACKIKYWRWKSYSFVFGFDPKTRTYHCIQCQAICPFSFKSCNCWFSNGGTVGELSVNWVLSNFWYSFFNFIWCAYHNFWHSFFNFIWFVPTIHQFLYLHLQINQGCKHCEYKLFSAFLQNWYNRRIRKLLVTCSNYRFFILLLIPT